MLEKDIYLQTFPNSNERKTDHGYFFPLSHFFIYINDIQKCVFKVSDT